MTIDRTLHTEAIATAFPGYADIGYARPSERNEDAGLQRTLAWGLLRMLARSGTLLNRAGLLPSIGMTLVTGSTRRLWAVPFAIWLDQISDVLAT